MLHNASFRTSNFVVVFWRDRKNHLLKTYSYDCSALKYYTTLQFSGDDIPEEFCNETSTSLSPPNLVLCVATVPCKASNSLRACLTQSLSKVL